MNQKSFPILKIVPTEKLILHEYTDPQRVLKLKKKFRTKDALMKNPVLVSKLENGNYLVLDGANRTTVFKELGIQHILVQIVDYKRPHVLLKTWNHLVCNPRFRKRYFKTLKKFKHNQINEMNEFVKSYKGRFKFYRVLSENFQELKKQYKHATCLVVFPKFKPKDIVSFTINGHRIPSGITRHVVFGRALRLGIPVEILKSKLLLSKKNQWLSRLISDIVKENRMRYYEEPVFIFDE